MDQIIQLNDKLMGLPAGVLVFVACIAFGYAVKMTEKVHNSSIPIVVMLMGVILFTLLAPSKAADLPSRIWIAKNAVVGWIIGFGAWMSHKLLIKRIEEKFGLFAEKEEKEEPK